MDDILAERNRIALAISKVRPSQMEAFRLGIQFAAYIARCTNATRECGDFGAWRVRENLLKVSKDTDDLIRFLREALGDKGV